MAKADSEDFITASDGANIFVRTFAPPGGQPPRAVLHVHHGMGEHSGRYAGLARRAGERGILVIAHDARGHGRTGEAEGSPGLGRYACGPEGAVQRVILDFQELLLATASARPGTPILVFGHSFGTIVAQLCLGAGAGGAAEAVRGLVLCSAPARLPCFVAAAFTVVLAGLRAINGEQGMSKIPSMLTFDQWNKKVLAATQHTGPVTGWEWLNRDAVEMQRYIDDPYCGIDHSIGFWSSLVSASREVRTTEALEDFPDECPVCLLEGSDDFCAVDDFGTRAEECVRQEFVAAGHEEPSVHTYQGARHELMLETNRDEIMGDVVKFFTECLDRPAE